MKVRAYVNGHLVKTKRGHRVTRLVVRKPRKRTRFTVKIVAIAKSGQRTISVRRYRRCKKTHPHTHVVKPH